VTVSCPAGGSSGDVFAAPVDEEHPTAIARVTNVTGSGYVVVGHEGIENLSLLVHEGDTLLIGRWTIPEGARPWARMVYCGASGGSATVEFYDRPDVPVTYSNLRGAPNSWTHSIEFGLPSPAPLVVDITIRKGAISVCELAPEGWPIGYCENYYESTQQRLSNYPESRMLIVQTILREPADYDITIRPLPVSFDKLKWDRSNFGPGETATLSYELDGATSVTAQVKGPDGKTVRTLVDAVSQQPGQHAVAWDGRDDDGFPVADGEYTLRLESADLYGNTSSSEAKIFVDGAGPEISVTPPGSPGDAAIADVTDANGIDGGIATVTSEDGALVVAAAVMPTDSRHARAVVAPPAGGWAPGKRYTLRAVAHDHAGKQAVVERSFAFPGAPGGDPGSGSGSGSGGGASVKRTLSAGEALDTLQAVLDKRLSRATLSRVACTRRSSLRLRCTFRGRSGRRAFSGTGDIYKLNARGRVRATLKVKIGGKTRRWTT